VPDSTVDGNNLALYISCLPLSQSLLKTPNIRFRIDFAEDANIGPGKIALLEAIKERGSLSDAARACGLSYRRGWLLLDSLNKSFDTPSTISAVGGRGGGGAQVTAFGLLLIERYRALESQISDISHESLNEIAQRVVRSSRPTAGIRRTALSKKRQKRRRVAD
jgi:molybdate transport system regulatory protein